jgi:hypothetical protein
MTDNSQATTLEEAVSRMFAAEKHVENQKEDAFKRQCWLDKAKRDAGYSTNVSFDEVWAAALRTLKKEQSEQ